MGFMPLIYFQPIVKLSTIEFYAENVLSNPDNLFVFFLFSRPRYFDGAAITGGAIPGLDLGQGRRRRRRGRYPGIDPGEDSSDLRRLAVGAHRGDLVFTPGSQELKIPVAMFTYKFKDGHGILLLLKTKIPRTA
jgi:hypothetical protein